MSLAELISGKKSAVRPSAATANPANVAKVDLNQVGIEPRLAVLATLAIAGTNSSDSVTELSRWFVLEADTVFKSSSINVADSWNLFLLHRDAAEACCRGSDISSARVQLGKALEALRGIAVTQPTLI